MVQVRICFLIAALCACCGLGSGGVTKPPEPVVIPVDNNTAAKSTDQVPETTTTPKPDSSPETTTTSTTPSTITTPSTTTPSTTTQSTTISTSTDTTTLALTSTPTPSPLPPLDYTWYYPPNSSNVTCIVAKFVAQLNITYSSSGKLVSTAFDIPSNASVADGSCGDAEQFITLSWPARSAAYNNTMTLNYAKNATTNIYALKSLNIKLSPDILNASMVTVVELTYGEAWQTPLTTSYRCTPATRLNLTVSSDAAVAQAAYIVFTKLQEEAFRTVNGTQFSAARECGGDVPDAVPIAVGCALGGLVLVVLVAYLVGRRRSSARGYLSM